LQAVCFIAKITLDESDFDGRGSSLVDDWGGGLLFNGEGKW